MAQDGPTKPQEAPRMGNDGPKITFVRERKEGKVEIDRGREGGRERKRDVRGEERAGGRED